MVFLYRLVSHGKIHFQTLVEIQVLIDDSEERFTEDQVNLLLDIVQTELLGQEPSSRGDTNEGLEQDV